MAQKSGFFNALLQDGVYDRTYNANDYSDNLAVVISNGVLRSINDDLKVTANGRSVSVGIGRAWINGRYYYNDSVFTFAETSVPTGGARYDRVMLRLNTQRGLYNSQTERIIQLVYVAGVEANEPVPPEPTRTNDIYDLVLADIFVGANASTLTVTDQRGTPNLCGWVYSNNKGYLFKRYNWEETLNISKSTVQFNIPQYDADTCFLEVYVNGILENETTDFTLNGNIITFDGLLIAGTTVTVKCYKSIEAQNVESVFDEITDLQNKVASIEANGTYTYKCTGYNDNASLSQIANAILTGGYGEDDVTPAALEFLDRIGGNMALANLPADAQITVDVVGKLGATTPVGGSGTPTSRYRWFTFGLSENTTKKLTFDFSHCEKIDITCGTGTANLIFYGNDVHIKSANVNAHSSGSGCAIEIIRGSINLGRITADDCRFIIATTGTAQIAEHGTFTNCYCYITSETAAAYCFKPKPNGLIKIIGGEFYAYGRTTSGIGSAIFHTSAADTDGVAIAMNIHCPVVTRANYSQGFLSVANAGATYINGVVTRLTSSGTYNTITGLINKNKA